MDLCAAVQLSDAYSLGSLRATLLFLKFSEARGELSSGERGDCHCLRGKRGPKLFNPDDSLMEL